jgi:hypothetical protein
MRRRWDYFVKNLAGGVPPVGYELTSTEAANRRAGAAGGPEDDEDSE